MSFDHLGEECSTKGVSVCTFLHAPRNIIKNIQFRSLFENDTFKIWAFTSTRVDSADLPYPCQSLQSFFAKQRWQILKYFSFSKNYPTKTSGKW